MQQPEDDVNKLREAKDKARNEIIRRARHRLNSSNPSGALDKRDASRIDLADVFKTDQAPVGRLPSLPNSVRQPIPPHEQLITHDRIPVHVGCKRCKTDLYRLPTEYTQYAALVVNWPEAWCPTCWMPQYVDLGESTRNLGDMPNYSVTAFLGMLKRLMLRTDVPAKDVIKQSKLQLHSNCKECGYDLFGLPSEYLQYAGRIINAPEVKCPECGRVQYVDVLGRGLIFHEQAMQELTNGVRQFLTSRAIPMQAE